MGESPSRRRRHRRRSPTLAAKVQGRAKCRERLAPFLTSRSRARELYNHEEHEGTQRDGVNPSAETNRKDTVYRSLTFDRRTRFIVTRWVSVGEAEASSAGEQLAKEYSTGDSSRR